MAIDERFRRRAQEWVAVGMMAVALGGGWYLVGDGVGELRFIDVGWWNIRDLSSASRDDSEIALIAQAIDGPEVLAVGELNDPSALGRIAEELGPSWEWAATDDRIGRSPQSAEYYGFLWDGDFVEMVGSLHVDPDSADRIDRQPAWATFRTADGGLDFTVLAVHITWGNRVANRKAEIRALDEVWTRTQNATPDDDDLVLVGDFNRNIGDDAFDQLLAIPGMLRANEDTGPTHVSSRTTYDQIFLSTGETQEWTGEYFTYAFDEVLFGNDDADARLAASDHRPVWITLFIPDQDDDP
jgi:endonuclease/exonuclease/phosphatase family metal-dependent hydrolase